MGIPVSTFIKGKTFSLSFLIYSTIFTRISSFMIGKCYEKIANTVDQEEYSEGDHITKRHYERLMMKALER